MDNKYYSFDSKGYLNTLSANPIQWSRAIENNDLTSVGGKDYFWKLIFGVQSEYITFPLEFVIAIVRYFYKSYPAARTP